MIGPKVSLRDHIEPTGFELRSIGSKCSPSPAGYRPDQIAVGSAPELCLVMLYVPG